MEGIEGYLRDNNPIIGPSEHVRGRGAADFTYSANDIKCRAIHKIDINRFVPTAVKTIFLVTKRNMILDMSPRRAAISRTGVAFPATSRVVPCRWNFTKGSIGDVF